MALSRLDMNYHRVLARGRYDKPMSELRRKLHVDWGLIDSEGNITPLGKKEHVVKEKLLGTETKEHYEEYLKHWDAFFEKWFRWATDERIPEEEEPKFDYVETWPSEQEEEAQKEQAAKQ